MATEDCRYFVSEAMQASIVKGAVVLEPVARNKAAALSKVIKQIVRAAQTGAIVNFGISPTFPSAAYGYIY